MHDDTRIDRNHIVTVFLTISMLGMMLILRIILSGSRTNIDLPVPLCDFDINWATIQNGYVDSEFIKMHANQLRQQVGHARPLLVLLDNHASHNRYDVIVHCLNLNTRLFFILPHTSRGLAACDPFNNRIH